MRGDVTDVVAVGAWELVLSSPATVGDDGTSTSGRPGRIGTPQHHTAYYEDVLAWTQAAVDG